jgi:hypothetical protein
LALAAASTPGTSLPASTAKELRVTEKELRLARDAIAKSMGKSPYDHTVWKQAVEQVSAGVLTADVRYVANFEDFVSEVSKITGVSEAETFGAVFSAALVKMPVLTSVTMAGNDQYASGHIVALLGVAHGNQSPPALAILNPAVKVGSSRERIACEMDDGVGDDRYQAFITLESKYALKKFPSGYLVLTVRKK